MQSMLRDIVIQQTTAACKVFCLISDTDAHIGLNQGFSRGV